MEFGDNMFCLNSHIREENENTTTNNVNSNSFAWYSWEPSTSSTLINAFQTAAEGCSAPAAAATRHHQQQPPLYGGEGSHVHPDPHLTCLKLGKRHYFEDTNNNNVANAASLGERHVGSVGGGELFALEGDKRAKGYYGGGGAGCEKTAAAFTVPRCQVEGCHVALVNAKEYHRRHKVCEMHSKAPKVVVLGREQRFCQQCSRFHVVSEFDDSKRSCRRRLAGHNERRRKSSHHSVARNSTQGCALSLLSPGSDSWLSHADFSIRCSAALHELIAENRAALMTRQLVLDRDWHLHHNAMEDSKEIHPESNCFSQQTEKGNKLNWCKWNPQQALVLMNKNGTVHGFV